MASNVASPNDGSAFIWLIVAVFRALVSSGCGCGVGTKMRSVLEFSQQFGLTFTLCPLDVGLTSMHAARGSNAVETGATWLPWPAGVGISEDGAALVDWSGAVQNERA